MCNCQKPCKFHNKDNSLTVYALCCGYKEYQTCNKIDTELYKEVNGYHVRQYDFNKHERLFCEIYLSLKEARKQYKKLVNFSKRIQTTITYK